MTAMPLYLFVLYRPQHLRGMLTKILSFYSHLIVKVLGIELVLEGFKLDLKEENYFIVSNHLSYVDILLIASKLPSCFVTSVEFKNTPFLGWLIKLTACLTVERRNKENIENEIEEISAALRNGICVSVFPEATSTDGSSVLKFRHSLFQAAINSNKKILPVTLNYYKINNRETDKRSRDSLFWYGEMTFFPHILKLMKLKNIHARLTIHEPLESAGLDKATLARTSQAVISSHYKSI